MSVPSISDLHSVRGTKERKRNGDFSIILQQCIDSIIYTNKYTDNTFIFFTVPEILISAPFYSAKDCIVFIIKKLTKSGYRVHFIEPNHIYVDWGKDRSLRGKIKSQTNQILRQFPDANEIIFELQEQDYLQWVLDYKLSKL